MTQWTVLFDEVFREEFRAFADAVKEGIEAGVLRLVEEGPNLGRPLVDTLKGSRHANMKELRFTADGGVWRVAFAFDPERQAILLVAGDKAGANQKRFYKVLIAKADERFDAHLAKSRKR